jgi:Uma2 family endonuclease
MATTPASDTTIVQPMPILMRGVPWAVYKALRGLPANYHIRMTYLDGTLELMSPEFVHDRGAVQLDRLVEAVAWAFGIGFLCAATTTLRRRRRRPRSGAGLEPDTSFYFGEQARAMARRQSINLREDPPPDLAIEADNTRNSTRKLRVYARLRVPEVWLYDVQAGTLWFGRLGPAGSYDTIEQSTVLPMLTRSWVLSVLTRGEGLTGSEFRALFEGCIKNELNPPPPPGA